jgi:hypothetical protein
MTVTCENRDCLLFWTIKCCIRKCFSFASHFLVSRNSNIMNMVLRSHIYATCQPFHRRKRQFAPFSGGDQLWFLSQDSYLWLWVILSSVFSLAMLIYQYVIVGVEIKCCTWHTWYCVKSSDFPAANLNLRYCPALVLSTSTYVPHLMHGRVVIADGLTCTAWLIREWFSLALVVAFVLQSVSCLEQKLRKVTFCLRLQPGGKSGTSFGNPGKVWRNLCFCTTDLNTILFLSFFQFFFLYFTCIS